MGRLDRGIADPVRNSVLSQVRVRQPLDWRSWSSRDRNCRRRRNDFLGFKYFQRGWRIFSQILTAAVLCFSISHLRRVWLLPSCSSEGGVCIHGDFDR